MVTQVRERVDNGFSPTHDLLLAPFVWSTQQADSLVCPSCQTDLREAGVLKVETGLTLTHCFSYHPDGKLFLSDGWIERGPGAQTRWQCRSCHGDLPRGISAYIDEHFVW